MTELPPEKRLNKESSNTRAEIEAGDRAKHASEKSAQEIFKSEIKETPNIQAEIKAGENANTRDEEKVEKNSKESDKTALAMLEALLFAAEKPLKKQELEALLPEKTDLGALFDAVRAKTADSGFQLAEISGGWRFQTAPHYAYLLKQYRSEPKKLSPAALETLSIIAYHQPVSRAEIEQIRGVSSSKNSLDILMEIGWVYISGRRRSPGKPMIYCVTEQFLEHFCLNSLKDLPDWAELKKMGLLNSEIEKDMESGLPQFKQENTERALEQEDRESKQDDEASFHTDYLEKES